MRVDLINEATTLNCTRRLMLRAFHDFGIGLYKGITLHVRLVMRNRKDVLQVTRILFNVDLMGAR